MATPLDLATHQLVNGHTIEASAGTGKTYSVAALVTRAIAVDDDLRIDKILITTFTRAAAAELRDRVRRRLADTAHALVTGDDKSEDPIVKLLLANQGDRPRYIRNLHRAVVNFDNATISTIHSVCSKILAIAGLFGLESDEELTKRAIAEVVNDRLVSESVTNKRSWDEKRVKKLLEARLANPFSALTHDENLESSQVAELEAFSKALDEMAKKVNDRTELHPSFNDLIRRAEEVLRGAAGAAVRARFAERYTHAFVDEAQDTDQLQWKLFHHVFRDAQYPDHKLIAVGDPKQAIYSFRGADVNSYLATRDTANMSTLDTNFRSDPPVIDALNALFERHSLGLGINYSKVAADPKKSGSKIRGIAPVEAVDIDDAKNQYIVGLAAAGQVVRLLRDGEILDNGTWGPITPRKICVLAGSNALVSRIQGELQGLGIPAVASGAESVFADTTAHDVRLLFEAIERINNEGRIRNLATTSFFGIGLGDPRLLPDDLTSQGNDEPDLVLELQEKLADWRQVLERRGVAALAAKLSDDSAVMASFVAGPSGERRLADFSHIIDLLHAETHGRGVTATEILDVFDDLSTIDGNSEVVSRRIESDEDAVQVMTIHKAKGLEFPCVVIADLWKARTYYESRDVPKYNRALRDGSTQTVIDIGWLIKATSPDSVTLIDQAQTEEQKRLIYVAFTRPENHLAFLWASNSPQPSVLHDTLNLEVIGRPVADAVPLVTRVEAKNPPFGWRYSSADSATTDERLVAEGPAAVEQSYRRTSFSGIAAAQKSMQRKVGAPEYEQSVGGNDENTNWLVKTSRYAQSEIPDGVPMPLGRIPGGTYVGKVIHEVYEHIDTSAPDLRQEVENHCQRIITGAVLREHLDSIVEGIHLSLITPLHFGSSGTTTTLADITPDRRLAELNFEMSVADITAGVRASDFGRVLSDVLPTDDALRPYAALLSHESFDIQLAGLINGSIDAVLHLGTKDDPELWITDYKSNRLDQDGDTTLISGYGQERLFEAMVHHHYPLQALIYGTAMYRYLRWRAPQLADPSRHVKGFSYFFIRGMVGPSTPAGTGVYTWNAPPGLWQRLSDRLAGDPQ